MTIGLRSLVVMVLLVTVGGLLLRLHGVHNRPMHADEAVNAFKFHRFLNLGAFEYDLKEYHGPVLHYATWPMMQLSGSRDFAQTTKLMYRLVPVVFGVGLIAMTLLIAEGLGRSATICAAMLTALSPSFVFFNGDYIHETLFVFFTFAAIGFGFCYMRSHRVGWAILTGISLALMHATKETAVLCWLAMFIAMAGIIVWSWGIRSDVRKPKNGVKWLHVVFAGVTGLGVWIAFFSRFFTYWPGLSDAIFAYRHYVDRAMADSIHLHSWHYYFGLLSYAKFTSGPWWSEALILVLAMVGAIAAVRGRSATIPSITFARFLVLYTIVLAIIYSSIPYKTPWNMLGFLHGMILLAGIGSVVLVRIVPTAIGKSMIVLVLIAATVQLGWQAHRATTSFAANPRNPYAYAGTVIDVPRLAQRADALAAVHPDGYSMQVKIIATDNDYWPIPWYLRRFKNVSYSSEPEAVVDAPLVVASSNLELPFLDTYVREHYGLRFSVVMCAYVQADLWDLYLEHKHTDTSRITVELNQ